ncbi:MAG: hypothetical protein ABII00_04040, partial [Elusimicrobiota bacterium]
MKQPADFLMIYPHSDVEAYSQRVLLSVLKAEGFSVHLLLIPSSDEMRQSPLMQEGFLDMISMSKIIGFGFMSTGYRSASYLTKLIRSKFKKPVIWGGPHCTTSFRHLIGAADAIFVGESEAVLSKYVSLTLAGKSVEQLPQMVTDDPRFIPANKDDFVSDLDKLPLAHYSRDGQTLIYRGSIEDDVNKFKIRFGDMHVMTTRGCPYQCSYCANSYLKQFLPEGVKPLRMKDFDLVIKEVSKYREIYGLNSVAIEDDLFLIRPADEIESFVAKYNAQVNAPIS